MNKQTETLSKATPKLPLTVDKPETSNGFVYVHDADGIEICTCYVRGEERAAIIIQAVNQYEALCAVMKAAKNLCLYVSDCESCDATGKRNNTSDACHFCGGSGKVCSTPYSGEAETLLKSIAALEAVRKGT